MLDADDLCGCWNEQRSFQHLDDVFFIESFLESKLDVVKCVKVADSSVQISCERMASSQQQTPLLVDSGGGGGGGGCALSSLLKSETPSPPPTQQQSQVTPPGQQQQQQQQQQIVTQALIENNSSLNTKCGLCNDTFTAPKVLPCFHTFCQPCLEKTLESSDKLECPQCHQDCLLSSQGVAGLLSDYAISNVLESSAMEGASSLHCTACKSNESSAIARCFDCANFLCSNCVMAHQFMHCFEGHRVITLGELQNGISKDDLKMEKPVSCVRHKQEILRYFCRTCNVPICKECTLLDHPKGIHDYEYLAEVGSKQVGLIGQLIEEGKLKTSDLRNTLKSVEHTSTLLQVQYHKAQNEINETFQFYRSVLEERKLEALKELDSVYNSKQVSLSCLCQKVQDAIDKTYQTCEFMERLLKYASNTEVLVFKKLLDTKLQHILDYNPDVNLQNAYDVEFVSNYQAIQVGIRNTFGYIRSSTEQASKPQPIARPNGLVNGGGMIIGCPPPPQSCPPPNSCGAPPSSQQQQSSCNGIIERPPPSQQQQQQQPYQNGHMSSFESNILSKRFSSANNLGPFSTSLTDLNPYEKWSSGGSSADGAIYQNGGGGGGGSSGGGSNHGGDHYHMSNADPIIELSNKLISSMNSSSVPPPPPSSSSSSSSSFPPKSQIKRQKMIYHCKFGEFGVMEGQFTEPSGVAVNAQNDIIVADTNNHRIQIFDKEGRFKFQFGECGKRDGQLLYPNRVAVVKTSGDIIVTERSPTHQIQIYNQYGQFVRKFGANILQHPRGVTVDNKGRVVVVECKVMRVIIFDQMGAVLQKFGCSKHLEFPNGVVVNDKQEIFISDNRAHCVKVFNYEGAYLRQIGGEGITNYPIGVGINQSGEILIADNHNNFNLTIFTQDGTLVNALESKVKHAQCFDVALMDDGSVVLASKDYRLYIYRYLQVPSVGL